MRRLLLAVIAMVVISCAPAQESSNGIKAEDAWQSKGETKTICGQVVDSSWASSVANAPTYLYLDRPRPEQVFTVVIPSTKRELFGDSPEKSFRGKRICVTGKIESDGTDGAVPGQHRVRIFVEEEDQIAVG